MTDPLALDRQVCFALVAAARDVVDVYRDELAPLGLTHPQYLVMLALWEESPQSLRSLAARLSLEPATLSPLLRRLETSGFLERPRDPADQRTLAVALTREGTALRERALDVPPAILRRLGMATAELDRVRDALVGLGAAARAARTARSSAAPRGPGDQSRASRGAQSATTVSAAARASSLAGPGSATKTALR